MAIIYCPQCDSEIPETTTVCPSCGFNLDDYDEDGGNEEFNALLNAANKKLSSDNDPAAQESSGSTISQSQIDALLGGNVVDLTSSPAAPKKAPKEPAKPAATNAQPAPEPKTEESAEKAEETGEKKEAPAEETEELPEEFIQALEAAPPAPVKEKKNTFFIVTIAAAVVALALGFCISLLIFGDVFRSAEESFAIKAANAVNSKLAVNENLCVYKAYVKTGAAADECILYAITDYKDVVTASKYRVVVTKDNSKVINIYYTVDENDADYLAMKNSEDPEVRIQASMLKNYSDSIEAAHREISLGTPTWVSVDAAEINSNITSKQEKAAKD